VGSLRRKFTGAIITNGYLNVAIVYVPDMTQNGSHPGQKQDGPQLFVRIGVVF
jgi:hypothetical protein